MLILLARLPDYSNRSEKLHNVEEVCGKWCAACAVDSQVFVCLLCCEEFKYFVMFCALIFVCLAHADWLFNMKLFFFFFLTESS